jgi:phosphoribosylglycinamide formyltransferase-1
MKKERFVRIGVLISGGGTNLQALMNSIENSFIRNAKISIVISSKKGAFGLKRAEKSNIKNICLEKGVLSVLDYNRCLIDVLRENHVDLVVLAGFTVILGSSFVEAFKDKIINIHPSLIPSFCGKGYYGEKVHQAVIDSGVKVSGATVHFVDSGVDTGKIILQKAVYLSENETVESLSEKILNVEHELLPKAVKQYCEEKFPEHLND